jgi:LCP family protein required for cell wall assembly
LLGLGALVAVSCFATATAVAYVYLRFGDLTHLPLTVHQAPPGEPENYLVVGSDSRAVIDPSEPDAGAFLNGEVGTSKRTDTIMVVRVDPKAGTIGILSFPRDLWIPIAGTGSSQRINTAYALGQQVLIDTIEQDFDVPINHYIEVNFLGFKGLVDALGGVPMYFDTPVRDSNTGLNITAPGCVKLDGDQALAFARSRHLQWKTSTGWHTDETADLGRITRQQVFVRKAMQQVFTTNVLDLTRIYQLIDVAHNNVTTDSGLDIGDLRNLASQFKQFSENNLATISLPVEPYTTSGGASVVRLLDAQARPYLNVFRGLPLGAINEGGVSVTVLNGTGTPGQASAVAAAVKQVGFLVAGTGNASPHPGHTIIRYPLYGQPAADLLARHLTNGAELVEDENVKEGTVTLVVGPDFTTVMMTPNAPTTTTTGTTLPGETTTVPTMPTTTTTVVGHTLGIPPPGVDC